MGGCRGTAPASAPAPRHPPIAEGDTRQNRLAARMSAAAGHEANQPVDDGVNGSQRRLPHLPVKLTVDGRGARVHEVPCGPRDASPSLVGLIPRSEPCDSDVACGGRRLSHTQRSTLWVSLHVGAASDVGPNYADGTMPRVPTTGCCRGQGDSVGSDPTAPYPPAMARASGPLTDLLLKKRGYLMEFLWYRPFLKSLLDGVQKFVVGVHVHIGEPQL